MARFNLSLIGAALLAVAAVCCLQRVDGKPIEVEWTPSGVSAFRDPSFPLMAELGDVLMLKCTLQNASNLFIQSEQIQHDMCNANLGSGNYVFNGFCLPGGVLKLTLTMNSRILDNTINFENNRIFYLTSYSDGSTRTANDATVNSGGQCLQGVRMAILIGEWPTGMVSSDAPTQGPSDPANTDPAISGGVSGGTFTVSMLFTIVPAVAGSIIVIAVAIVITVFLIKVCYAKTRKPHNDPLSHHNVIDPYNMHQDKDKVSYRLVPGDDQGSPRRNTLGHITTQTFGVQPNYYVDQSRVVSGRERSASRWSDQVAPSDQSASSSEVTVAQQFKASNEELCPKPSSSTRTTSNYNFSLPPSTPGSRRTSHDEYATYANVTETDLASPHYNVVSRHEGDNALSSFSHQNVWRLV